MTLPGGLLLARRGAIAASRVAGTLTTYTLYATTACGEIDSSNATYATARAGSGLSVWVPGAGQGLAVGQVAGATKTCVEGFLDFDTSGVAGTVQSVTLSLYGNQDFSTTDFTIEARLHDWGGTLETTDWVAGADLSSKTLLASYATASGWAGGYRSFTSEAAFVANINQAGHTRFLVDSSRHVAGNSPTTDEYVNFYTSAQAGTTQDPKLVIVSLV